MLPGGLGLADLFSGRSAVRRLSEHHPVSVGAPVTDTFGPLDEWPFRFSPRALQMAVRAVERLDLTLPDNCGLVLGMSSLFSEPEYLEFAIEHRSSPEHMVQVAGFGSDHVLHYLARRFGIEGPRLRVDAACASGSDALIAACDWVRQGFAPACLVVAAASMLNPIGLAVFRNLRALSSDKRLTASRPFDCERRGFVMGEGAAAMLITANPTDHGSVLSWGQSMNAYKFTDLPEDLTAMETATRLALGPYQDRVAYVCAHGTGTLTNDRAETRLHKRVFGQRASEVPLSSVKSMTGHCLGASSLIEVMVTLEALKRQLAPPTINLDKPSPDCDLDYVPLVAKPIRGRFALTQAFAFGGHNSSVLVHS